jgi:probable HAF family extracellular repeat protein
MRCRGALSGDQRSDAFGINDAGHVVGTSFSDASSPHAFVYTSQAGMVRLQSLLEPDTGHQPRVACSRSSG